jgi:hypothetical protein
MAIATAQISPASSARRPSTGSPAKDAKDADAADADDDAGVEVDGGSHAAEAGSGDVGSGGTAEAAAL